MKSDLAIHPFGTAYGDGHLTTGAGHKGRAASWKGRVAWGAALVATTGMTAAAGIAYDLPGLPWVNSEAIPQQSAATRDAEEPANALVRSTLLALHHANVTDNYSVLHQLAAPAFQNVNSAERLSLIFKETRRRQLDLSVAAHTRPHWTAPPAVAANGQLRMKGFYPVAGGRLYFDLVYAPHKGMWRLLGISVSMQPNSA